MEYDEFMSDYNKKHAYCPKCGHDSSITTLMGYIFDSSKPEEYKDLNRSTCTKCGNTHKVHDRIENNNIFNIDNIVGYSIIYFDEYSNVTTKIISNDLKDKFIEYSQNIKGDILTKTELDNFLNIYKI